MERRQIFYYVSCKQYDDVVLKARSYFLSVSLWAKEKAFPSGLLGLMETLAKRISERDAGDFYLRECFSLEEWKNLSFGLKGALGRQFNSQVDSGFVPGVRYKERGNANVAKYIKL